MIRLESSAVSRFPVEDARSLAVASIASLVIHETLVLLGLLMALRPTPTELFGSGGGKRLERDFGVPLLGQIPLLPEIRSSGDAGTPLVVEQPEHPVSRIYLDIAERVLQQMAAENEQAPAPRIIG